MVDVSVATFDPEVQIRATAEVRDNLKKLPSHDVQSPFLIYINGSGPTV